MSLFIPKPDKAFVLLTACALVVSFFISTTVHHLLMDHESTHNHSFGITSSLGSPDPIENLPCTTNQFGLLTGVLFSSSQCNNNFSNHDRTLLSAGLASLLYLFLLQAHKNKAGVARITFLSNLSFARWFITLEKRDPQVA